MQPYQPPQYPGQQPQQPQYPQGPYPPAPPPQGGYEFSASENTTLNAAATWTLILGCILILEGLSRLVGKNSSILSMIVSVAMGILLITASQSLKKVTTSQGQDVQHLMKAFESFDQMLLIRVILLGLALVAVGIAVAVLSAF
ncbi:MAG: hypothetical protein IPJ34_07090 [Myxococcales bacterium]|nr:hypothetical protein [Myxococcales bacterium]